MPDTLSREQIAAIRERDAGSGVVSLNISPAATDRRDLLAHIDALTAAVAALPEPTLGKKGGVSRAAVLAILRGEQPL